MSSNPPTESSKVPEASAPPSQGAGDRQISVDSAVYFEQQDEYDAYDDFGAAGGGGGGGKTNKRRENRGGGGGSVYSSKHTRQKEAQREAQGKTTAAPSKK